MKIDLFIFLLSSRIEFVFMPDDIFRLNATTSKQYNLNENENYGCAVNLVFVSIFIVFIKIRTKPTKKKK